MVIKSSCPTRCSLMGGGTDIPTYSDKYGGACLSMAINIRQEFEIDTEQIGMEIPKGASPKFYKAFFDRHISPSGFKASFDGEITGGIGSSASAAVAILGGLHRLTGKNIDKYKIAEEAWDIEVNDLKMFGGRQDQYAAAFGGVNCFQFGKHTTVTPLHSFIEPVKDSILLFHIGKNRESSKIQEGFKDLTVKQVAYLNNIKKLVIRAIEVIPTGNIKLFGELLELSWRYKKESNKGVSNPDVDSLMKKAKDLGSYGGKCLGAGGGGYCIFVVEPSEQKEFIKNIGLKHIDYEIDYQGLSSRVIIP